MAIAAVIGFCVLLLILAFVAPRLSRKPFDSSQKAVAKSGGAGRRGRSKMPL